MGTVTLGEALNANFGIQTGTTWLYRTAQKALYSQNSGGRNFGVFNAVKDQLITLDISAAPTPTNATLQSTNGNVRVYKVTADGTVTFNLARYNYIYSISVADPVATNKDYTIKYVDSNGDELKQSTVKSGEPGSSITLDASDKADFIVDGQKYIYVSDDVAGKTIAADNSTVVTITYRTAATYTYNVVSSTGKAFASGSNFEGETVYTPYAKYLNIGGTLYEAPQASGSYWSHPFLLNEDNHEEVITYNATSINNVVYFTETEDVEGAVALTGGNASVRCSMQAGGYYEGELTTLEPGKYTLSTSVWGGAGTPITFKAGDANILEVTTTGSISNATSNVFVISEPTIITIEGGVNSNNSPKVTDYIYIVKTGDINYYNVGDDATAEITNPSFETGNLTGWTPGSTDGGDTGVKENSNGTYTISNADGNYVYNTWGVTPLSLSQSIYLTPGNYMVKALLASDKNNVITLACGSEHVDATMANEKGVGQYETLIFNVTAAGYVTLSVTSDTWFKADGFTLTYLGENDAFATMTVSATAQYGTFCAPFAVEVPAGVTASTATIDADGETIVLASVGATIAANTPVILYAEEGLAATTVYGKATAIMNPTAGVLTGVYSDIDAPNGSYILQNHEGHVAFFLVDTEEAQPKVRANRAYLTVPDASAKPRMLRFGSEEETAISAVEALVSGKAEIYSVDGVKLNKLQKGINIVNGKKVLVK